MARKKRRIGITSCSSGSDTSTVLETFNAGIKTNNLNTLTNDIENIGAKGGSPYFAEDDNVNAKKNNNAQKENLKTVFKVYFNNKLYILDDASNLKEILESFSIKKITYNAVDLEKKLIQDDIKINGIYDLSILYYHLIGVKANNSLVDILYFIGFDVITLC